MRENLTQKSLSAVQQGVGRGYGALQELADQSDTTAQLQKLQGMADLRGDGLVQLRGENPHDSPGDNVGGHSQTAHHIIGHAKLSSALGKLDADDQLDVLVSAIPDVLTSKMMDNVKVVLLNPDPGEAQTAELAQIRRQLVDRSFDGEIASIDVANIRSSFYEWMGGNQFSGPNTAIRAEPETDKDALDTDGQYIFGAEHGGAMNEKGTALYSELETGGEGTEGRLKTLLLEITTLAKNVPAAAFNPDQWHEVIDSADIPLLVKKLKRQHLKKYVFLKAPAPGGNSQFADPYNLLKTTNSGGSEVAFGGKAVSCKVSGGFAYFPSEAAKKVKIAGSERMSLRAAIIEASGKADSEVFVPHKNSVQITGLTGGIYRIISIEGVDHFKLNAKRYGGQLYPLVDKDNLVMANDVLDKQLDKELPPTNALDTYLHENGAPVSTWLPKELYDTAKAAD